MNRVLPRPNGFTFLEVLIAIVGIGMVITGLGATVAASLRTPTLNREIAQATFMAQHMMDRVAADRRQYVTDGTVRFDSILTACPQATVTIGGAVFSCAMTTASVTAGSDGCPTDATTACQQRTITITTPAGGVISTTMLFVRYEN
ncbi:MAG: hypothetical protein HQL58_08925 [Magnetococcales bacterium]|nr:hypothetical protein [Magnetococcales bacterium]